MKCFDHPDSDAIGLCRHCLKGLCSQCAADTGEGLACAGSCEAIVVAMGQMVRAATSATKINTGGAAYLWPIFFVATGIVFGFARSATGRPMDFTSFEVAMAALFIIFGLIFGVVQFQWRRRANARP